MLQRGVTLTDIEFVLEFYTSSFTTQHNSTELRAMLADGRVLKVWIVGSIPLTEPVIIKSVAWMEKPDD
jgi:hypothetical protein